MLFAVALALTLLVTSAAYAEPASTPAPRVLIFGPTASSSAQLHARATAVETQIARLDRRLAADLDLFSRGGILVLDKIEEQDYNVLRRRPYVTKAERARLLLGALARTILPRGA